MLPEFQEKPDDMIPGENHHVEEMKSDKGDHHLADGAGNNPADETLDHSPGIWSDIEGGGPADETGVTEPEAKGEHEHEYLVEGRRRR